MNYAAAIHKVWKDSERDGEKLSPVDLSINEATAIELPPLNWNLYHTVPVEMTAKNSGFTVTINAKFDKETPYVNSGPLMEDYKFSEIHFHWGKRNETGSGHAVAGVRYPLEMHVVHIKKDCNNLREAQKMQNGTVIMVHLFTIIEEYGAQMDHFAAVLSFIQNYNSCARLYPISLSEVVHPFMNDYFFYWGTIGSPSGLYRVLWFISRNVLHVTSKQLDGFRQLYDPQGKLILSNTSNPYPLDGRSLFLVSPSEKTNETIYGTSHRPTQRIHYDKSIDIRNAEYKSLAKLDEPKQDNYGVNAHLQKRDNANKRLDKLISKINYSDDGFTVKTNTKLKGNEKFSDVVTSKDVKSCKYTLKPSYNAVTAVYSIISIKGSNIHLRRKYSLARQNKHSCELACVNCQSTAPSAPSLTDIGRYLKPSTVHVSSSVPSLTESKKCLTTKVSLTNIPVFPLSKYKSKLVVFDDFKYKADEERSNEVRDGKENSLCHIKLQNDNIDYETLLADNKTKGDRRVKIKDSDDGVNKKPSIVNHISTNISQIYKPHRTNTCIIVQKDVNRNPVYEGKGQETIKYNIEQPGVNNTISKDSIINYLTNYNDYNQNGVENNVKNKHYIEYANEKQSSMPNTVSSRTKNRKEKNGNHHINEDVALSYAPIMIEDEGKTNPKNIVLLSQLTEQKNKNEPEPSLKSYKELGPAKHEINLKLSCSANPKYNSKVNLQINKDPMDISPNVGKIKQIFSTLNRTKQNTSGNNSYDNISSTNKTVIGKLGKKESIEILVKNNYVDIVDHPNIANQITLNFVKNISPRPNNHVEEPFKKSQVITTVHQLDKIISQSKAKLTESINVNKISGKRDTFTETDEQNCKTYPSSLKENLNNYCGISTDRPLLAQQCQMEVKRDSPSTQKKRSFTIPVGKNLEDLEKIAISSGMTAREDELLFINKDQYKQDKFYVKNEIFDDCLPGKAHKIIQTKEKMPYERDEINIKHIFEENIFHITKMTKERKPTKILKNDRSLIYKFPQQSIIKHQNSESQHTVIIKKVQIPEPVFIIREPRKPLVEYEAYSVPPNKPTEIVSETTEKINETFVTRNNTFVMFKTVNRKLSPSICASDKSKEITKIDSGKSKEITKIHSDKGINKSEKVKLPETINSPEKLDLSSTTKKGEEEELNTFKNIKLPLNEENNDVIEKMEVHNSSNSQKFNHGVIPILKTHGDIIIHIHQGNIKTQNVSPRTTANKATSHNLRDSELNVQEVQVSEINQDLNIKINLKKSTSTGLCHEKSSDAPESQPKLPNNNSNAFNRSPINLEMESVELKNCPKLNFINHWNTESDALLENNGKTLRVTLEDNKDHPYLNGGPLIGNYKFYDLHFHWGPKDCCGTEHIIDGQRYPLEGHFMYFKADYESLQNAMKCVDGVAIVAVILNVGGPPNPLLDEFVKDIPLIQDPGTGIYIPAWSTFAWMRSAVSEAKGYFSYKGMLTSQPPHVECVTWVVFPEPVIFCCQQSRAFRMLTSTKGEVLRRNFRHPKPLNNRTVYFVPIE